MYSSYYWTRYTEGCCFTGLYTEGCFMYSSYWTRYTGLYILKDVVYVFFLLLD